LNETFLNESFCQRMAVCWSAPGPSPTFPDALHQLIHAWQEDAPTLLSLPGQSYWMQMQHAGWYQQPRQICAELQRICSARSEIPLWILVPEYLKTIRVRSLRNAPPQALHGKRLRRWRFWEEDKITGRRLALRALQTSLIALMATCVHPSAQLHLRRVLSGFSHSHPGASVMNGIAPGGRDRASRSGAAKALPIFNLQREAGQAVPLFGETQTEVQEGDPC
jgi:hypothetical protein